MVKSYQFKPLSHPIINFLICVLVKLYTKTDHLLSSTLFYYDTISLSYVKLLINLVFAFNALNISHVLKFSIENSKNMFFFGRWSQREYVLIKYKGIN